jgi:hypothetical protein
MAAISVPKEFLLSSSQKSMASAILLGVFLAAGGTCHAQAALPQSATPQDRTYALETTNSDSTATVATASTTQPVASDAAAASPAQANTTDQSDGLHFTVSPYLWFPGVHGTVGADQLPVSIHASPGDLLSHFRFGIMGVVEPRYKRILLPLDIMWVRLEDDKALPLTPNGTVAKLKGSEFILTQKVGYRLLDYKIVKIDALAGFRFWHFGQSLSFTTNSLNFSSSQNWIDPVVGGRITGNLSPKVAVIIAGDAGGWGAGSQLDYQIAGILGYRIKPALTLQAGYRYLSVDWRNGGALLNTHIDMVTSGALIGVSIQLK